MSAAIGFGEYETLLPCDGVNAALTFSRELFSREYVVQRVTSAALAGAAKQNEDQWRGLARIHPGHVVVGVDGVPVRGLSSRQFAERWYPQPTSDAQTDGSKVSINHRRVRFRDRKRAEVEIWMQKDWPSSRFTPIQDDAELQAKLREARTLIWSHELTQAYVVLHALPAGSDPMVCLLAAELEAVRVLVSKDILYCKQAQRAANQAVTWLEGLHELPQSYSSRTQMKLVLAEALFLSSLLRLGGDQRLAAIATARRCAALYVELHEKFFSNPDSASKRDRLLMPKKELRVFQKRVRFGMGVLHGGGALALQNSLDWVGTLLKGTCDVKKGVEHLLDSSSVDGENEGYTQANWAALTLMHSSGAIRLIRQRESRSEQGTGDQLARSITTCHHAAIQRHPKALLFLWSQAATINFDGDHLEQLEVELARVSALEERVHLVRFDVGYRCFVSREFARASAQFMPICKCSSAPSKLRGLSSLFIAVGYLLSTRETSEAVARDAKQLNSVRLLLRSARRFLALRLEDHGEDFESASLYERLGAYVDSDDGYLQFLPWEILYVYCHCTKTTMVTSRSDPAQHQHHVAALEQLSRLSKSSNGEPTKQNHEAELCLLRVIVLFNLRDLDGCEKELQRLWSELHPQGGRPRTSSTLGRLLSPRSPRQPPAFVAPVAWFYQLRLLLERRCSRSTLTSIEKSPADQAPIDSPEDATTSFAGAVQEAPYPYHYVYSGKLQALNKLVTRLANDKINSDSRCSSPMACNT
ncbi:hypothetical protein PRIC1_004031 [Phytophthora ramorum]|uniref:uncharacterized protein n=1 Tax=Phytophthora ramorum TaxID=164328 RepID=UPI0030AAB7BF|nr:hypothetical protein KRP23_3768 [Phytophthora ramorum]